APGPGVTRLAYDDAWCRAHAWLASRARALGLAATPDAAGNLFFHDPALRLRDAARPVLLVGSHLDSVVRGGRYDGAYGLIAGLLIAARAGAAGGTPVVAFATCEEEESRFHGGLMGARSLLGQVEVQELDRVTDSDGVRWREALERARTRGCASPLAEGPRPFEPAFRAAAMIELHIEQGPLLEAGALALGLVEHIAGYRRLTLAIAGESRHSGTTPMGLRRDALTAAAEMILAAEAEGRAAGDPAVATVGYVRAEPGLANVVPGTCELWLEARHADAGALERLDAALRRRCGEIAAARGVGFAIEERSRMDPTPLSSDMVAAAERLANERGIPHRRMASGAAHDAMVFARAGVPTLMVFVPSRGGISHSPEEHTDPENLALGCRFVADLIPRLARSGASS
ncbi:MAG TPA: M20 family metallo-hydrolase, partial [Candidatus Eisenbacteria bacterium]